MLFMFSILKFQTLLASSGVSVNVISVWNVQPCTGNNQKENVCLPQTLVNVYIPSRLRQSILNSNIPQLTCSRHDNYPQQEKNS